MKLSKARGVGIPAFLLLFAVSSAVSPAQHASSLTQNSGASTNSEAFAKRIPTQRDSVKRFAEDLIAIAESNAEFSSPLTGTRATFTSALQFLDGPAAPASSRAPPASL